MAKAKKKVWTASQMGKVGGPRGGKARSERLTPEERSAIARMGALARAKKLSAKERSAIARKAGLSQKKRA